MARSYIGCRRGEHNGAASLRVNDHDAAVLPEEVPQLGVAVQHAGGMHGHERGLRRRGDGNVMREEGAGVREEQRVREDVAVEAGRAGEVGATEADGDVHDPMGAQGGVNEGLVAGEMGGGGLGEEGVPVAGEGDFEEGT